MNPKISRRTFIKLTGLALNPLLPNFLPRYSLAQTPKEKIVILGGGIAALTTAFELTNIPDWQNRYDITLYQTGWRLGGKGASGRDLENHDRIEEYGLHIWFGFYQNAFNLMWQVYTQLGNSATSTISNINEAFVKQNFTVFEEKIDDEWLQWVLDFPVTDGFPGIPDPTIPLSIYPSLWNYVVIMVDTIKNALDLYLPQWDDTLAPFLREPFWWHQLGEKLQRDIPRLNEIKPLELFDTLYWLIHDLGEDPWGFSNEITHSLVWLLQEFRRRLDIKGEEFMANNQHELRRIWMLINLALTCVIGILKDGAIYNGLESLDDQEFQAWLLKHEAHEKAVHSTLLQSMYDSSFAYEDGDITKPSFAAGTAMRVILRVLFTYQGAIIWKMKAGMGDVIFAPLYQVLKQRGVKFQFFHRVTNLQLSADGTSIDGIEMGKQADLLGTDYNPLVDIKGVPCWMNRPLYDQLVQGAELKASGATLESRWTPWQDVGTVTLKAGMDFDKIVLGIPVAALKDITPELSAHDASWEAMLSGVKTTQTQALQLWFKPDREQLARVEDTSHILLNQVRPLWAGVSLPHKESIDWDKLVAPSNLRGAERLKAQYMRANVDPTERYDIAAPNTTQYRKKTDQSGFANLYLTGTWINSGFNFSCIEVGVITGKQCARAVSGYKVPIIGEDNAI